jgi:hypothetical protein
LLCNGAGRHGDTTHCCTSNANYSYYMVTHDIGSRTLGANQAIYEYEYSKATYQNVKGLKRWQYDSLCQRLTKLLRYSTPACVNISKSAILPWNSKFHTGLVIAIQYFCSNIHIPFLVIYPSKGTLVKTSLITIMPWENLS